MRVEVPTFKRCCFCIPLRYGLISWGCLRLVLACMILILKSYALNRLIHRRSKYYGTTDIVMVSLNIIIFTADIIMGIIFIYGCFKKNAALIKKYYYHNIFLLTVVTLTGLNSIGMNLYDLYQFGHHMPQVFLMISFVGVFFSLAYIFIQSYVTLLVRSQMLKLENDCQFQFENNAVEAECSMTITNSSKKTTADCNRNGSDDQGQYVQIDV